MKVLKLADMIATQNGEPYACKTRLGRCIFGPIVSNKNGKALRHNRIAVKHAITGKPLSHHFIKDPS